MEEEFTHHGLRVRIQQDPDPFDPEEGDTPVYLVHVHRDLHRIPQKGLPFTNEDELRDFFEEIGAPGNFEHPEWAIFPIASYIHSGITMALDDSNRARNFPDRQWDVSRCGWIFIKNDGEWGKDVDLKEIAEGHVEAWNKYLSGDIWGYIVERIIKCKECGNVEYEHLDSCWGFYSRDECEEEARASAEHHGKKAALQRKKKKHCVQLYDFDLTIEEDSLEGVMQKINNSGTGYTSVIETDEDGEESLRIEPPMDRPSFSIKAGKS